MNATSDLLTDLSIFLSLFTLVLSPIVLQNKRTSNTPVLATAPAHRIRPGILEDPTGRTSCLHQFPSLTGTGEAR